MGLKKDKTLIFIEITLLVGLALFSLVIQYAQNEVDTYNYDIITKQNDVIKSQGLATSPLLRKIETEILSILGSQILPHEEVSNNPLVDEMYNKFNNGEITSKEFDEWLIKHYNNQYIFLVNKHNGEMKQLETMLSSKPKCFFINCGILINILFFLQVLIIVISLILYIILIKNIGKQYYTKIENKYKSLLEEYNKLKYDKK